ncbi:hypothetical protein D3C85_1241050 [compost metagenome]
MVAQAVVVAQPARLRIDHVHADRRLDVFLPIGGGLGVRQVVAVYFHQHRVAAPDLLDEMRLQRIVERHFLHHGAVQPLDVVGRVFEEGEVIALEILRDGEGQRGARLEPPAVEQFDPQVDVAVGLLPDHVLAMQRVRRGLWRAACQGRRDIHMDSPPLCRHAAPCRARPDGLHYSPNRAKDWCARQHRRRSKVHVCAHAGGAPAEGRPRAGSGTFPADLAL